MTKLGLLIVELLERDGPMHTPGICKVLGRDYNSTVPIITALVKSGAIRVVGKASKLAIDFDAKQLARRADPQTSRQAAERTAAFKGKHEAAIFGWLLDHPAGGTYREIAAGTNLEPVAVARRMKGLQERAGVYADGERKGMTIWKVRRT